MVSAAGAASAQHLLLQNDPLLRPARARELKLRGGRAGLVRCGALCARGSLGLARQADVFRCKRVQPRTQLGARFLVL